MKYSSLCTNCRVEFLRPAIGVYLRERERAEDDRWGRDAFESCQNVMYRRDRGWGDNSLSVGDWRFLDWVELFRGGTEMRLCIFKCYGQTWQCLRISPVVSGNLFLKALPSERIYEKKISSLTQISIHVWRHLWSAYASSVLGSSGRGKKEFGPSVVRHNDTNVSSRCLLLKTFLEEPQLCRVV